MNMNANNEHQLAAADDGFSYSIMPRNLEAQISDAINMRNALNKLFEVLLEPGKDFDRIPGTDKPTLLKPGSELLCKVFKLAQGKADVLEKSEDWEKGIFSYTVGMPLIHIESGFQIAYGIGAANSMEKKHRYRKVKAEGGQYVQIENPDPADLQNTLIKMANKRAFVDAVLKATGASRMFTQDMEDLGAAAGQVEKASTKQRDLIKKLFGGMPVPDALAEISVICGRDVASFEDIYRSEASRVIDAKKADGGGYRNGQPAAPPAPPSPTSAPTGNWRDRPSPAQNGGGAQPDNYEGALACADCGAAITSPEYKYSTSKFGRPLCRKCQTTMKEGA